MRKLKNLSQKIIHKKSNDKNQERKSIKKAKIRKNQKVRKLKNLGEGQFKMFKKLYGKYNPN